MPKLIGLFRRKDGLTAAEFRDYYENHHAPFAVSLFGHLFAGYTRSYVDHWDGQPAPGRRAPEFDVVTEIVFADEAAMEAMFAMSAAHPEVREAIVADEAAFMNRDATRLLITKDHAASVLEQVIITFD
ncbi:EthD domain-containing protein [Sphaerimonospora cavernae]|uniref:EthD domain-containing protein n=1 Tax=Sphaerimonospora cavernae TaxID=1740611 RepID=A0ABV6U3Z6_9ACTN